MAGGNSGFKLAPWSLEQSYLEKTTCSKNKTSRRANARMLSAELFGIEKAARIGDVFWRPNVEADIAVHNSIFPLKLSAIS
jgi:hypothetical protein